MLFLVYILSFVIAIAFAFWCAKIALGKGRSPAVWGVLGFLFPLIALIVLVVLPPGDRPPVA